MLVEVPAWLSAAGPVAPGSRIREITVASVRLFDEARGDYEVAKRLATKALVMLENTLQDRDLTTDEERQTRRAIKAIKRVLKMMRKWQQQGYEPRGSR